MYLSKKRSVFYLCLIALLLIIGYLFRFVLHPHTQNALWAISLMTARWMIQVPLTVLWIASIRRRILNRSIRKLLMSAGALLLFWQVVRVIKYDYVIITEPIGRYLWYCFYIPMVLVPLIGVFVTCHIGKSESYRTPKWMRYLFIPALILILLVFTNDLHQKVFVFYDGFSLYNSHYSYGFLYFVVMAWFILLALFFVVSLMVKSRVPGSKRFQKLPLAITFLAIVFWTGYSMKLFAGDLTAVDCLIIIMLLESSIQSGLIPSNMNYSYLFDKSTVAAQITDQNLNVRYRSKGASESDRETLKKALCAPVNANGTVLHSQSIRGGYVFWQDDIQKINLLAGHLQETNDLLSERFDLMKAEIALKERRIQAEEKARMYDAIAREIAPQLDRADFLLREIENGSEHADRLLSEICILSAYIKRKSNLILLSEESSLIPTQELEFCLRESLDNLCLTGAAATIDSRLEGQLPCEILLAVYDRFEMMLEALTGSIDSMRVHLYSLPGKLTMLMEISAAKDISALIPESLSRQSTKTEAAGLLTVMEFSFNTGGAA